MDINRAKNIIEDLSKNLDGNFNEFNVFYLNKKFSSCRTLKIYFEIDFFGERKLSFIRKFVKSHNGSFSPGTNKLSNKLVCLMHFP